MPPKYKANVYILISKKIDFMFLKRGDSKNVALI